jgi:predicted amidophosphoribosyltransferase
VFLFGVPMYLGYLAHRDWPARIACPVCGQPAPRDRETCLACGEPFAPPAPKGIEVFA